MPHRQNFETISSHTVVDPIPDAIKVQPPHVSRTRFVDGNSDIWLHKQEIESSLQILAYGARSCRPVDCPPLDDAFDFASGASRDEKFKRHSYP
jgi:hypothetical protein